MAMQSGQERKVVTRRGFLRRGAVVAAAPWVLPASALGREAARPPSDRIVMGCIGVGGRGRGDTQVFLASSETQIVAVCDVDRGRCNGARKMVDDHYAAQRGKAGGDKDQRNDAEFRGTHAESLLNNGRR